MVMSVFSTIKMCNIYFTTGNTLYPVAGYPSVYYQFLYNVLDAGMDKYIIPLPMPSIQGAIYLKSVLKKKVPFIFIDACHDYECVLADILAYFPLLKDGGIMIGDDFQMPGVARAVNHASAQLQIPFKHTSRNWMIHNSMSNSVGGTRI
jgi:hypothetical protein